MKTQASFIALVTAIVLGSTAGASAQMDVLYGTDSGTDALYEIEFGATPIESVRTIIGTLDPLAVPNDPAIPNRFRTPVSMTVTNDGTIYVVNNSRCEDAGVGSDCTPIVNTELVVVDETTGAGTSITDPTGMQEGVDNNLGTLAYDGIADLVYAVEDTNTADAELYVVDEMLGVGEHVATIMIPIEVVDPPVARPRIFGAEFNACGDLFLLTGGILPTFSAGEARLYRVTSDDLLAADPAGPPEIVSQHVVSLTNETPQTVFFDRSGRVFVSLAGGGPGKISRVNLTTGGLTPMTNFSAQGAGFAYDPIGPVVNDCDGGPADPVPEEEVETLLDVINDLVSNGDLKGSQSNGLKNKLLNILALLDAGDVDAAIIELQAFINQVEGFVGAGKLDPAVGQALIDQAQAILDLLSV